MTTQTITAASQEYFRRPQDQEMESLDHLIDCSMDRMNASSVCAYNAADVNVSLANTEYNPLRVNGYQVTPWAYNQFCARLKMPADFVRKLMPETMLKVIQEQQLKIGMDSESQQLSALVSPEKPDGRPEIRAMLSTRYERIWDAHLFTRVKGVTGDVLKPAGHLAGMGSATGGAGGGTSAAMAAQRRRSGIYCSDRNTFAFLVNPTPLPGPDGDSQLYRGTIIGNSETGERKLFAWFFAFDSICANHIVWGAQQHETVSMRHIGKQIVLEGINRIAHILETWLSVTPEKDIESLLMAKNTIFAEKAEEREKILRAKGFGTGIIEAAEAHAMARAEAHGTNPSSVWGVVSGLTRAAQDLPYAGDRLDAERAAGKLLPAV